MKCLIFETKEIQLFIEAEATRPLGILPELSMDDCTVFVNVVVVWLCVESGDTIKDANIMVDEIFEYHLMVKRKVVIVPFFHLSESASLDDEFNKNHISYVSSQLKKKKALEGKLGYGFHRSIVAKWMTFGHNISAAFRSSKYYQHKFLEK